MTNGETHDGPALAPPESGVVVRMYHTGFGDCFLLAFRGDDGRARHVLIDCGVHQSDSRGAERLRLVAKDIARATGNRLAAVAVTHEHLDHISGFVFGEETFGTMTIDNLWLAWTENPHDSVAQELIAERKAQVQGLRAAVSLLEASGNPMAHRIQGMLGLEEMLAVGSGGRPSGLDQLRRWAVRKPEAPSDYLVPGTAPFTIPGVPGVRCYVLGPPRDIRFIKRCDSTRETYPNPTPVGASLAGADAMEAAQEQGGQVGGTGSTANPEPTSRDDFVRSCPFDERSGLTDAEAEHGPCASFFEEYYGFTGSSRGPEWRRIETDWLDVAGPLALSIRERTNNTSLVLAFELTGSEPSRVLLFVGDAQVGNWLSWQDLSWAVPGSKEARITIRDLLARTVLYKVGHHGSRNATLAGKGLELMAHPALVAMLPVDQEFADQTLHWHHPEEGLRRKLTERTKGRVIRSDRIPGDGSPGEPGAYSEEVWGDSLNDIQWDRSPDRLWIQYTIHSR